VSIQESLDFPGTVYGVSRQAPAVERMSRQSAWFAAHLSDRIIDQGSPRSERLTPTSADSAASAADRPSARIVILLAAIFVTFPRKRLVQVFTRRFSGA